MTDLWLGSGLGLALGWIFQRAGLARPHTLKEALGMRQRSLWRMLLIALGTTTVCVAFLGWLAVLDVDHLEILPLNGTLVVGSLILGAAMGFTGYTPGSMLAQLGGGKPLAGLCAVAGGVAGAVCYGWIASPVEAINGWFPEITGTLSRTTLTSPFLLSGGFLLHGAVGVILLAVGLCVGRERPGQAESPQAATHMEAPPVRSAETAAEAPPSPEDASAETVVAALPQEEPWTLDTVPVALPPEVTETLTEEEPHEPSLPEETTTEDRETLARAGKTPMASAATPAEEPVPIIRPQTPEEKSDRTD